MNINSHFEEYDQDDLSRLYQSGSIVPNIDAHGNLIIQNVSGELYSSAITIPLVNVVYNNTKVETNYDVNFTQAI